MKNLYQMQEVLESWRRCIEKGISQIAISPAICLEKNAQVAKLKENVLLSIFEECISGIHKYIDTKYLFLLVDCNGILIKKK